MTNKLEHANLANKSEVVKGANRNQRNPGGGFLPGMRSSAMPGADSVMRNSLSNNLTTDSMPLLSTISELQRERKLLKSKVMKEKLSQLCGEDSYVNRYIKKVAKANINETKEELMKIETEMGDLNDNYKVNLIHRLIITP